ELGDEPVIRGGGLVATAVSPDLGTELARELLASPFGPAATRVAASEERRDDEQPDDVGEVVIPPRLAVLEMAADESSMQQQARDGALHPPSRFRGLAADHEGRDPVNRADRYVHGARPVDAELDGIGGDPA